MANEQNLKPFKKGNDPRRVGNGRPRKFVSFVLEELRKQGYENIRKGQIVDIYETFLALPEELIDELISDKKVPMIYRIVGKEMLSKRGFDVIERMIDRTQGKPTNKTELSGEVVNPLANFEKIALEGIEAIKNEGKNENPSRSGNKDTETPTTKR